MNSQFRLISRLVALGVAATAAATVSGADDPPVRRSQVLTLHAGWNAVFLEVDPVNPEPDQVFAGLPVDIAAGFFARTASAQYVTNPDANIFRRAGWGVWYGPGRPDSFLSTLHAISGQRAYLVHATDPCVWQVTGSVVRLAVRWQPDAYNLVGFAVARQGSPTFAEFFSGSRAHALNRIYRLENDAWRRVTDPTAETMRSGEAFWVYCDGSSDYQGPLRVEPPVQQGVVLLRRPEELVLRNDLGHPLTPTVELVPAEGPAVPLSLVMSGVRGAEGLVGEVSAPLPAGPWVQPLPAIEAGQGIRLPFEARREEVQLPRQASLLKISTDIGTEDWIPVICLRQDLEEQQ
ncbi:MAG: hypothetical protein H7A45_00030 [Verrucomicrobiales bacterium]|nr:hypothetical protein [Verrucomicrobiales bacterium]